jgi:Flp pilus assembly protein TadG
LIKFLKDESGQSVVEFALVAPILILLLCGIIDFGWILSAKLATDNCAREGARYASVCEDYGCVKAETSERVQEVASPVIKNDIKTDVTFSNPSDPGSGDITVVVTSRVKTLTIVADTIFGGDTVKLTSSVTMRAG